MWDNFSHTPGKTHNGDTGDVADNSYNRYDDDIKLVKEMGLNAFRFSIAWSRILPTGYNDTINEVGITHYNKVIDSILKAGLTPLATLWHWDTPMNLETELGGWLSAKMEVPFAQYADICFARFGDRVKNWLTLNEPMTVALNGYDYGSHAPGRCSNRTKCSHGNRYAHTYKHTRMYYLIF